MKKIQTKGRSKNTLSSSKKQTERLAEPPFWHRHLYWASMAQLELLKEINVGKDNLQHGVDDYIIWRRTAGQPPTLPESLKSFTPTQLDILLKHRTGAESARIQDYLAWVRTGKTA